MTSHMSSDDPDVVALRATNAQRIALAQALLASVTDTPRLDAEILLATALDMPRAGLLARLAERTDARGFDAMLERRLTYEPLAYILGEWEFYSLGFKVVAPLLVPRPETEHLVEAVLEHVRGAPARVLDCGTGTGCVAVAIAYHAPGSYVVATDVNPLAVEVAVENAARHGVAERVGLRVGDLFGALSQNGALFDVVCSNPPYVEEGAWPELSPVIRMHEDPAALLAGADGLDVIRRVVQEAARFLRPGGLLAFEIGESHHARVAEMLGRHGYENVRFRRDLAGIERVACAERPAFECG